MLLSSGRKGSYIGNCRTYTLLHSTFFNIDYDTIITTGGCIQLNSLQLFCSIILHTTSIITIYHDSNDRIELVEELLSSIMHRWMHLFKFSAAFLQYNARFSINKSCASAHKIIIRIIYLIIQ